MIQTTFFNFCTKSSIFQVLLFWHKKFDKSFILSYFRTITYRANYSDKLFLNIRTMYQTMCRSCKKVVFVWKMMMASNKRFTNRVTRSVLEIRSPHFYARPSQARAIQERSGFVFPSTDRVTRLINLYYNLYH